MMKNFYSLITVLACMVMPLALCVAAEFDEELEIARFAIAGKISTLGPGVDAAIGVAPTVGLRVGFSSLNFSHDDDIGDIDYDFEFDSQSFLLLVDLHPFKNNFRISVGAVLNDNKLELSGKPKELKMIGSTVDAPEEIGTTIGSRIYTPEEIGTLKGDLDFDDLAPYVGLGFGRAFGDEDQWVFSFDIGVMIQSFDVSLSADGVLAQDPEFQSDLKQEEEDVDDELDIIKFYPVVAFGVGYLF